MRRNTILLLFFIFLFIFCVVSQVWADPPGTLNGNFYQGKEEDNKFGVKSLLESLKANKRIKLAESIDKIFSLSKLGETAWRYKFLDHPGVKETKSPNSEYGQSILKLYSNVNRYLEEGGAQVTFELLQSKLKRTEIFILFHLSFDLKGEQMFLEMHLTPSSDKGVNFFIPF